MSVHPDWTEAERQTLGGLDHPAAIQAYLDATPYSTDPFYRAPRRVMRERLAHCVDGALLAAAALEFHGARPLVVDLRAVRDDDHVIAVYQLDGCWGAIAKSNTVGLRSREPVFRSLRELAMSYFEVYYNLEGEKSLREVSRPVDLRRFDRIRWRTEDGGIEDHICVALDRVRHARLLTPAQIARLTPVDRKTFEANLLGSNPDGLWKN